MRKIFSLFALALLSTSAWAANTYVKVNSIDQLEVGKKYIIVNEESSRAMGAITGTSTNYGSCVDITIADGVIDIEGTGVAELVAGKGSMDEFGRDTWNFDMYGESHYIIWTSGNSLNTVNIATGVGNAMWIATLTDDGVTLKNRVDNSRILQYNAGSPRFACYASAQKPAVLYVQGVPEEEGITTLSQANALEDNENFTFDGDAVVTVFKNGYLFLRDESGYGMISGVTGEFENGQVLSQGWNATKTSVSDTWVRYTDAAGLSASGETNAELAAAQKLTSAPDESMLNAYVYIENALPNSSGVPILPQRYFTLEDNSKLYVSDILWASSWDASGNYNFYGVLCKERGQVRINVVGFEPYVPQPEGLRGDVNEDTNVNVADVAALINYLLTQDPSGVNLDNADCTLDEQVNVADMAALINYLLVGTWE